jgi:hypothetical protein
MADVSVGEGVEKFPTVPANPLPYWRRLSAVRHLKTGCRYYGLRGAGHTHRARAALGYAAGRAHLFATGRAGPAKPY